jgi:hypothetical protein
MANEDATYAAAELASKQRENPNDWVRDWAGLIDDKETVRYLNYLDDRLPVPVESTERGRRLIESAASDTIDEAVAVGNVSQMKTATGMTNKAKSDSEFFIKIADYLSHEGTVGLIFGSPGSGKTAKMLDIAQVWRGISGGSVLANIDWSGADGSFKSDRELFEGMASREGQTLALIDEIAQELSGFGSGSKDAEAFTNSLLLIRKYQEKYGEYPKKGSALAVAHTRTKTAKSIRRLASFGVEIPDKTNPGVVRLLDSVDGKDEWSEGETHKWVQDTAASYSEYDDSSFDILEAYDDESGESRQLDEWSISARRAVRLHIQEGWTQKKAAEAVDYSKGWVSSRVQEYRDGELDVTVDIDESG